MPLRVFADDPVKTVVAAENALKHRMGAAGDQIEPYGQDGNEDKEDEGKPGIDGKGGDKGEQEHEGRAYRGADNHLIGVLDVGNIGGEAGDKAAGGKMIDIGKGKILDVLKHVLAKVFGKACGGDGGIFAGKRAKEQGQERG